MEKDSYWISISKLIILIRIEDKHQRQLIIYLFCFT